MSFDGYPPHFRAAEFVCGCEGEGCDGLSPNPDRTRHLAWALEVVRQVMRKPIAINSGIRCGPHNRAVGGSLGSQHLHGAAADLRPIGATVDDLHATLLMLIEEGEIPDGGLGAYDSFVHYDIGAAGRRWDERTPDA